MTVTEKAYASIAYLYNASGSSTLNIYGGKGASKSCGIIVMTTGGTVNVSGGDWTSNGDGSVSTSESFELGGTSVTAHAGSWLELDDIELVY